MGEAPQILPRCPPWKTPWKIQTIVAHKSRLRLLDTPKGAMGGDMLVSRRETLLVGGFNPSENIGQNGNLFPGRGENKNICNHHPDMVHLKNHPSLKSGKSSEPSMVHDVGFNMLIFQSVTVWPPTNWRLPFTLAIFDIHSRSIKFHHCLVKSLVKMNPFEAGSPINAHQTSSNDRIELG